MFSFAGNAQLNVKDILKKSDKALADINTVVYKVDYKTKYLSRKDTVQTTAVCSLYIARKDKMKAYNIVDMEFFDYSHSYGHRKYDGNRVLWTNYPIDSLNKDIKPKIYSDKQKKKSIVENYSTFLLKKYFWYKHPFAPYTSFVGKIAIKDIAITEEVHNGIPVYLLTVKFKDEKDTRDSVEKHYIRKSDYLPIALYSFLRWENMEQYNYCEIDYLAINPDIPLETFKVDTTLTEMQPKLLYEKVKKYGL